jgi:hypothetical protein
MGIRKNIVSLFKILSGRERIEQLASIGVISGKDAERFVEQMELAKTHKISKEERDRLEKNYKSIMKKSNL